ncbi:MAG: protein kinase, partial [Actinomycetota bacterium]
MTPETDFDRDKLIADHRVGKKVGDFILESVVGQGGMGVVYRAVHESTGATVALKLMLPEFAANRRFRERFIREAQLGPRLSHPNIVPIIATGEADGELFIAMELIEGADLKALIEKTGPLDLKAVVAIFRQAAAGLDAAHEAGIVHRD